MSFDIIVKGGTLPDGKAADIGISGCDDRSDRAETRPPRRARSSMRAGNLVSPPFVDPHFHMDATLSYGLPRINASGTLLEGIALWGELKPMLTYEAVRDRALAYCDWAVSMGLLAIRTHVDTCDNRLLAVEALLDVKKTVAPYYRPATGRLSAGRLLPKCCGAGKHDSCAGQGCRHRRRHPAFRAHHGGRYALGHGAVRDRCGSRSDGRHALRRDGRSAVAAHRAACL